MAKRFIDTGFFKDPFVRGLQGAYKGLYIYLFLDCSNAGIWNVELDVAKLRCGIDDSVSDEDIKEVFKDKIIELEGGQKWFLINYIKLQHNGLLKRNNKAHTSAIEELLKYDLIDEVNDGEFQLSEKIIKGLPRGLQDPKVMVKVKVKDKVEEKGNGNGTKLKKENFEKIDFDKITKIFNETCSELPDVQKLTDKRKSAVKARVKEYHPEDVEIFFQTVFGKVSENKFLNGDNDRGWKADFDWILNPNNLIKILEGNYNGKSKQTSKNKYRPSDEIKRRIAEKMGA